MEGQATTRNGIDLLSLFSNEISLDDILISKRTICISRVVKINKDGNETIVRAK